MPFKLFGFGLKSLPEQVDQNTEDIKYLKARYPFNLMGEYNETTQYLEYDFVSYQGSSYIAKKDSIGVPVTNTNYWQVALSK